MEGHLERLERDSLRARRMHELRDPGAAITAAERREFGFSYAVLGGRRVTYDELYAAPAAAAGDRPPHAAAAGFGILSDRDIAHLCRTQGMVRPFDEGQLVRNAITWGLSSYGYDLRLGAKFKVFDNWARYWGMVIDPKATDWHCGFTDYEVAPGEAVVLPPNSFCLAESLEEVTVPRGVLCVAVGKSTYARCAVIANVTPLEPEWQGKVTIELSNTAPLPAKVYAGEGIVQVLFFYGGDCARSYADKRGRYNHQAGLTLPSVRTA